MIGRKLAPDGSANELELRTFIEQAPVAIAMFDHDMCYLAASRRWISDFKPADDDILGRNHYQVFPRLPARMRDIHKLALAGQTLRQEQDPLERSDGRLQYINWEVQPWRDTRGEIAGVIMYALDVTAEVLATRALAESEARYRLLAEASPDIICRTDLTGLIQYVSPACRQLGYTPEHMIGRSVLDFIEAEHHDDIRGRIAKQPTDPTRRESSLQRVRCEDGRLVWLEGRPVPVSDDAGEVIGMLISLRDVTEQKRLELELIDSEARFRQLAAQVPDVIVRYDMDGVIEYVSPAVVPALGYAPEEVVGRTIYEFATPGPGPLAAIRAGETPPSGRQNEFQVRRRDGRMVWAQGNPAPLHNAAGEPTGVVSVVRDVTEQRALEAQLADNEARYRLLAEHSPDVILRLDIEGRFEYVSPAIRNYGREPAELIGQHIGAIMDEAELGRLAGYFEGLSAGRLEAHGSQGIWKFRTAAGEVVEFEGVAAPVNDDAGSPIGVIGVLRDMTHRRALEADLAASESRYRLLAERGNDITVQTDADGVLRYVSPSCTRILGYGAHEMLGRSALEFIHREQHAFTSERMVRLYGGDTPTEEARPLYRAVKRGGGEIWLEGASTVVRDDAGQITGAISQLRDVTEQRAAMLEVARNERKLRGLFELAPVGIALTDMTGRYVEFNEAFRQMTGYVEHELRELDYWTLTAPECAEDLARQLEVLHASGRYGPYEKVYVRKDGSRLPVRLNGLLIESPEGEPFAWSIVEDITEQLKAEAVLIEARSAAEAAAVAKSEFLANMSHEIRTPLTGVVGFAGLLESMPDLPDPARRYAQRITTSAETLLAVVNDVLDFSKLEARQMELDPHAFDAVELAETVSDLVRDRAARKGLALVVRTKGAAPPRLFADSARLRQVLLNFLTNAVKFTDTGAITVTTRYDAAAARLRVAVADTGVGVPREVAGRLFQRFSQADASSTRQHGGTGLGLAICKALIEMMDGAIGLTSEPGAGSTFWFEIPAPAATAADEPAAPAAPASDIEVGRMVILVVDDVAVNRELIGAMLSPFDVTLVEADSGAEAVKAAMAQRFDIVLMDLQMPGMDGMAATKAIRANSDLNRATPILAISANVLPEQVAEARGAGMDDHIAKPIDPGELIGKIAQWTAPTEDAVVSGDA